MMTVGQINETDHLILWGFPIHPIPDSTHGDGKTHENILQLYGATQHRENTPSDTSRPVKWLITCYMYLCLVDHFF